MKGYVTGRNLKEIQGHVEEEEKDERPGEEQILAESIPILSDKVPLVDLRGWTSFPQSRRQSWSLWRFGAIVVGFIHLWLLEISLYSNGNIDVIWGGLTAS